MSIQLAKFSKLSRLIRLFIRIFDVIYIFFQFFGRILNRRKSKVFFQYKSSYTHPTFSRFYTDPPVPWSTFYSCHIAHWLNYPRYIGRKSYLIECNDHPLSVVGYFERLHEPYEILARLHSCEEVYLHDNCKAILVTDEGQRNLFDYYFGNLLNSKLYGIIAPGCIPRVKSAQLEASFEKKSRNFLCLASDFQLKGVDLVLAAWSKVTTYDPTAKLYVVCPNVPHWARNKYSTTNSIIFVNGGPINPSLKHKLYSDCDVSIALTHSHGGGVIAEALEYGHVIISAKWHCSAYEAVTRSIEMPYYFYEPNMYGKKWKTLSEFKELLETDKRSGVFDNVIQDLASEILRYATDHEITNTTRLRNLNCAETGYSLKKRNMMLSEIYQKLI